MLIRHYDSSASAVFGTYYNNYKNMLNKGYPVNLRKISVTNGNLYGVKNGWGGRKVIELNTKNGGTNVATIKLYPDNGQNAEIFKGTFGYVPKWYEWLIGYGIFKIQYVHSSHTITNNSGKCSIDAAPGGIYPTFRTIMNEVKGNKDVKEQLIWQEGHCFMPVPSVLDISEDPDYCTNFFNINLVAEGRTPFDAYWGNQNLSNSQNMDHVSFNQNLVDWLTDEIETYKLPYKASIPLCQIAAYSINLPTGKENTPITWTTSNHFEIVSGQGTKTVLVRAVSTGQGWITATPSILTYSKALSPFSVTVTNSQLIPVAPQNITQYQTWNTPYLIDNSIYIQTGATLIATTTATNAGNIYCSTNAAIIIHPNGGLFMDGVILTTAGCGGNTWKGIQLLGNNSSLIMSDGSILIIPDGAQVVVESGATFMVEEGASLIIQGSGKLVIKQGGYLCVEPGANINLQDYNSVISMQSGAIYGAHPSFKNSSCLSSIAFTGNGCIPNYSQDVYIQNETITNNRYVGGRNAYIGPNVTINATLFVESPGVITIQDNVIINNPGKLILETLNSGRVVIDDKFDLSSGGFEIK